MTFTVAPSPVIVDASVAVDAVQADSVAVAAFRTWTRERRMVLAPAIVWPEIANALLNRRRPAADVASRLGLLEALGLETADRGPRGVAFVVALAERHRLTAYDATYLWLAIDVDGELATRDKALARAAVAEGVPLAFDLEPAA